jgi:hypothetical protein
MSGPAMSREAVESCLGDLSDVEWQALAPLLPEEAPALPADWAQQQPYFDPAEATARRAWALHELTEAVIERCLLEPLLGLRCAQRATWKQKQGKPGEWAAYCSCSKRLAHKTEGGVKLDWRFDLGPDGYYHQAPPTDKARLVRGRERKKSPWVIRLDEVRGVRITQDFHSETWDRLAGRRRVGLCVVSENESFPTSF